MFSFFRCSGTVLSGLERKLLGAKSFYARSRSIVEHAALGLVVLPLAAATGTSALAHVNMPVKVVFKSSKLLPTMLAANLINGIRYSLAEIGTAAVLCVGVVAFTLADASVALKFDSWGVVLLSAAVLLDSMVPNCQQLLMR